jgi:hypothetical protein
MQPAYSRHGEFSAADYHGDLGSGVGSNPHGWLPEMKVERTCCGSWIDGGRWYVFQARMTI